MLVGYLLLPLSGRFCCGRHALVVVPLRGAVEACATVLFVAFGVLCLACSLTINR